MESSEPILSSAIVLDEFLFLPERIHGSGYGFESPIAERKRHTEIDRFAEFAKKTFRRYEDSNLNIDAFSLCLINPSYTYFGLASEWTLKALKLGATDLTFRCEDTSIAIPLQEVFRNENVVQLRLERCEIEQLKVTECPGLKSLTLEGLRIKVDALFDIISCCPSVENMSLSGICILDNNYHHDDSVPSPGIIFQKLRSLVMLWCDSKFQIETFFLDDLSSKSPNLKHLTLGITPSLLQTLEVMGIISSASLETLHITGMVDRKRVPRVEFDVPSIRKFIFEGIYIPNLSFRSISCYQWEESHVSISNISNRNIWDISIGLSTTWFRQLSNFLTNLRGSKIHLCLHLQNKKIFDYDLGELDGLNLCEVEDLTLDIKDLPSLICHALLDGLFRICRPKTITQYAKPPNNKDDDDHHVYRLNRRGSDDHHNHVYRLNRRGSDDHGGANTRNNDLFICRALERVMREKGCLLNSTQFMYWLRDLEAIDAQQLIDEVWTPQPLESVLADAADSTLQRRFRLQLKWKQFVVVS